MIFSKQRFPFFVFGLIVAVATTDVSIARADVGGDDDVISTICGAGTLKQCGQKDIITCEYTFNSNANLFGRSGGLGYSERCFRTGSVMLYKDFPKHSTFPTNCGSDDPDAPFIDEVCEG